MPNPGAAPECVKDYALYFHDGSSWVSILTVKDNHHRRRKHEFHQVSAQKLRVEVQATNGVDTARLYEVWVYNQYLRKVRFRVWECDASLCSYPIYRAFEKRLMNQATTNSQVLIMSRK